MGKNKYAVLMAMVLLFHPVKSQIVYAVVVIDNMMGVVWDVNVPVSNKYINSTSLAGFNLQYRKLLKRRLSVGIDISWNAYSQHVAGETQQTNDGAITTDFYKYLYALPIALNMHYYFFQSRAVIMYGGLGLGALYSVQKKYYSTHVSDDDNWGFLVRPEVGALILPARAANFGFLLGTRFSYSTNTQETLSINGIRSLGFQAGLIYFY
jgi:hypothetical protein